MSALWIPTSWEGWTWQVVDFSQVQAYPLPRKPLFAIKCTTHIVFYLSDRISGSNSRHDARAHTSTLLCTPIESVRTRYWLLKPPEVDAVYERPCRVEGEGGMKRGRDFILKTGVVRNNKAGQMLQRGCWEPRSFMMR